MGRKRRKNKRNCRINDAIVLPAHERTWITNANAYGTHDESVEHCVCVGKGTAYEKVTFGPPLHNGKFSFFVIKVVGASKKTWGLSFHHKNDMYPSDKQMSACDFHTDKAGQRTFTSIETDVSVRIMAFAWRKTTYTRVWFWCLCMKGIVCVCATYACVDLCQVWPHEI